MHLSINTTEPLSPTDLAVLRALIEAESGTAPAPTPALATGGPKKAAAAPKKAAAPAKAEEPEPEPEVEEPETEDEDLVGDDAPTLKDAKEAATKMVSAGKAADVKAALNKVGAGKVSEIATEDIPKFLEALGS